MDHRDGGREALIPTQGSPYTVGGHPLPGPHGPGGASHPNPLLGAMQTPTETVAVKVRGGFLSMFVEGWKAYARGFTMFLRIWLIIVVTAIVYIGVILMLVRGLVGGRLPAEVFYVIAFQVGDFVISPIQIVFGLIYLWLFTRNVDTALGAVDRRAGFGTGARWPALLGWNLVVLPWLVAIQYFALSFAATLALRDQRLAALAVAFVPLVLQLVLFVYLPFAVVDEQRNPVGRSVSVGFRTILHLLVLLPLFVAVMFGIAFGAWSLATQVLMPLVFHERLENLTPIDAMPGLVMSGFITLVVTLTVSPIVYDYFLCCFAALYRARVGGVAYESYEVGGVVPPVGSGTSPATPFGPALSPASAFGGHIGTVPAPVAAPSPLQVQSPFQTAAPSTPFAGVPNLDQSPFPSSTAVTAAPPSPFPRIPEPDSRWTQQGPTPPVGPAPQAAPGIPPSEATSSDSPPTPPTPPTPPSY